MGYRSGDEHTYELLGSRRLRRQLLFLAKRFISLLKVLEQR